MASAGPLTGAAAGPVAGVIDAEVFEAAGVGAVEDDVGEYPERSPERTPKKPVDVSTEACLPRWLEESVEVSVERERGVAGSVSGERKAC